MSRSFFPSALIAVLICLLSSLLPVRAEDPTDSYLMPEIHGTLRPRWEMLTSGGEMRFQMRNARLSIRGRIVPGVIDYYAQTDLCDRGKIKILDAWGRLTFVPELQVQAGQFRVPFGTDCFRGPGNYLFANRSFIGKTVNNIRGVGAKVTGHLHVAPGPSRLIAEVGVFNPSSMADHDVWYSSPAMAGKLAYTVGPVKLSGGLETLIPDSVRINSWDVSLTYQAGRWLVEGEYLHRHYAHDAHRATHAYNVVVDYWMPVKVGVFRRASVQSRYDGMSAYSSGIRDEAGRLTSDHPSQRRLTLGATLSYVHRWVQCDVRINYENYFRSGGSSQAMSANGGDDDKICAELVVKF